ncbi:hypothetical protein WNY97_10520 [Pseudoalteromonas fuliginea]|uniref:hypothetical protein n=1 Tax=Pseudoalteromonas TaxID=53246 RepID=UPI0002AA7326|nr:hypothetical protein [Pseudoalteromonas sp. Bsw20308]ALQ07358.1 hypothetical protein D172_004330 [Pseudoalteromonas sp. Bsw20308]
MNIISKLLFTTSIVVSSSALASWDGALAGKINTIDVAPGQSYGFRVSFIGAPKLCGSSHAWAYLNESDSNYNTFVSVLLAAKMGDREVVIYSNKETSSGQDYCHIGYIALK